MAVQRFRKKPVEIEAIQWTGDNKAEVQEFCSECRYSAALNAFCIDTLEGIMIADLNDWIIKGIKGEFYPCKPDVFKQTYDKVGM